MDYVIKEKYIFFRCFLYLCDNIMNCKDQYIYKGANIDVFLVRINGTIRKIILQGKRCRIQLLFLFGIV